MPPPPLRGQGHNNQAYSDGPPMSPGRGAAVPVELMRANL